MLNNLAKQKFTLETAEDTSAVFDTLSLATATNKELMTAHGSENESFAEELKSELDKQEEDRAKLDSLFAQDSAVDEDLLRELDRLSISERVEGDQQRVREEMER